MDTIEATHSSDVAAEIVSGDSLTLIQIGRQFGIASATVLRWLTAGLPDGHGGRVRLEARKRGKVWLTSRAALHRFFLALPTEAATQTK